jgi:hypothetical protein
MTPLIECGASEVAWGESISAYTARCCITPRTGTSYSTMLDNSWLGSEPINS